MNFRDTICSDCVGKKYARQCRQSRAWREDKHRRYMDLLKVDFRCTYGLPIVADAPADVGQGPMIAPLKATERCDHLVRVGCCKSACKEGFEPGPHCKAGVCASFKAKG